ncbi:MAG: type II secretion system F family protein [Phycisphaeraceae bacterium]|nr:type II secretion system F family protein [Phycisphaeraceae bacterium]
MPVYRYIAIAPSTGARQRGELTADTAAQVRSALRKMGLAPTRVTPAPQRAVRELGESGSAVIVDRIRGLLPFRNTPARRRYSVIEFFESLATLLATGTPLVQGLELLATHGGRSKRGRQLSTLCRELAEGVRGGATLPDAMAARPDWFTRVDLALVRSASESGQAENALNDLAEAHSRSGEVQGRLASALAYPTLLSVFGVAAVVFLTTTTLPQLAGVLQDAGVELPMPTEILLAVGDSLRDHTLLWTIAAASLVTLLGWLWTTPALARARLRIPVLGPARLNAQLGSASTLMARLLEGGVPLCDAVTLTAPTVRNRAIRDELIALGEAVREGRSASESLASGGVADPVFCRVVGVGEESGELAPALRTIGARRLESSERRIDRLTTILEPAVILLLAAMVGFVVYAAILPMLRVTQTL